MELLMENKGKIMNNYLFNLKFTVSKTGLNMLHWFELYFLYYRYHLHYGISGN